MTALGSCHCQLTSSTVHSTPLACACGRICSALILIAGGGRCDSFSHFSEQAKLWFKTQKSKASKLWRELRVNKGRSLVAVMDVDQRSVVSLSRCGRAPLCFNSPPPPRWKPKAPYFGEKHHRRGETARFAPSPPHALGRWVDGRLACCEKMEADGCARTGKARKSTTTRGGAAMIARSRGGGAETKDSSPLSPGK